MINVVGGMGHEIAGLGLVEVSRRQGLNMAKEPVSYPFFYSSGCANETSSPYKAKDAYEECQADDIEGVVKKSGGGSGTYGQIIHGPFDDPWYEQLKDVHHKE
jgi:hypothetical protein